MKVIFLDIDGVLNKTGTVEQTPDGFIGIDESILIDFSDLAKELDCRLVLSSDWKDCFIKKDNDGKYLVDTLNKYGLYLVGFTPFYMQGQNRGIEIKKYLDAFGDCIDDFIIIDDNVFDITKMPDLLSNYIRTDYLHSFKHCCIYTSREDLSELTRSFVELLETKLGSFIEEGRS